MDSFVEIVAVTCAACFAWPAPAQGRVGAAAKLQLERGQRPAAGGGLHRLPLPRRCGCGCGCGCCPSGQGPAASLLLLLLNNHLLPPCLHFLQAAACSSDLHGGRRGICLPVSPIPSMRWGCDACACPTVAMTAAKCTLVSAPHIARVRAVLIVYAVFAAQGAFHTFRRAAAAASNCLWCLMPALHSALCQVLCWVG